MQSRIFLHKVKNKIVCVPSVFPRMKKSTHESFVSTWFSSSGTQDVSVARWAPSNPLSPFALYPRKLLRESLLDFYFRYIRPPVAALPVCPSPFLALWKQAFSARNVNVQAPAGRPDAYKRKKHSDLLCFLVAGRRIELRTSWLWIMRSNQLSYPAMIFSWDRRTRTLTDRARICSATITPYLNLASLF